MGRTLEEEEADDPADRAARRSACLFFFAEYFFFRAGRCHLGKRKGENEEGLTQIVSYVVGREETTSTGNGKC